MTCVVCKQGQTKLGKVTVTLDRGPSVLVFKHVPAQVCGNCGEEYVGEETTRQLLKSAEHAVTAGVQVNVREYVAA